ncbi:MULTISPECIES: HD domain-containing protein [Aminobacterium]|jgi:putative hydrolase of HD superfamily|uniref:HD domain-containing protein n=1 Tax=Aminobacterium TaxID=81466 RepID=UPI000463A379|nr:MULTISPECIES: HD domain-containing protein [Aminobacterium]
MINRSLIERIFSAASIERWNDHPRPIQFTELAKQAHKMIIAYVIARHEEDQGTTIQWHALIEGGIFEFLHRVILTDIKPPVFHKLMGHKIERDKLNLWVIDRFKHELESLRPQLLERFRDYLLDESPSIHLERRILKAAHYLATKWEFDYIYEWSRPLYGIEGTRDEINRQIKEHDDLGAVKTMLLGRELPDSQKGIYGFIALVGQLRFQKRWAQTPRVPETSVLGHLLIVAILSYFMSIEIGACPRRLYNNFYGGLFHDLPEVLTRDIISPVKNSVEGLDDLIKEYERQAMEEKIYPLIPIDWRPEIRYFTEDEFCNRIWLEGDKIPTNLEDRELDSSQNKDEYNPIDGKIIEACDKLSAFVEASLSMRTGITSPALDEAKRKLYSRYANKKLYGFPVGQLFDFFW